MGLTFTKKTRSPYWYVRGTIQGIAIFESTKIPHGGKTRPSKIAEDYRTKRADEIEVAAIYGRKHNATFLDDAVSYLEGGGSPRFLGEFKGGEWTGLVGKLGPCTLRSLDQNYLNRCAAEMYPKCSAETINRQFWTPFIAVWNHGTTGNNPLCQPVKWQRPHVVKKKKPRTDVTYADVVTFINACDWHAAKILFFLFWTGCRPEEALTLLSDSVFPDQQWASLVQTKTDIPRGIPLHPCLIPLLTFEKQQAGLTKTRDQHVFVSNREKPYAVRKQYNDAGRLLKQGGGHMKKAVSTACKNTGLNIVPYNARHTVSTYLVWPGAVDPRLKDEILGHADASDMSSYYVHLPRQPLIDAIKVLPDPRELGLRKDLWDMEAIQEKAASAYRDNRHERADERENSKEDVQNSYTEFQTQPKI
ncbi:tyrosine-type recombinase/integrase [Undibacterium sp. Di26W]|uniref:tyrosine-type recombinase/integrase n=1 Tax=Undibacterium sp. Di26W TaxID=3413035 RepID=UPI003BEF8A11